MMKDECSIVRDLLPLYAEDMLSPHTKAFVAEHLRDCPDCRAEGEKIQTEAPGQIPQKEGEQALKALKKRLAKRHLITFFIAAVCIALVIGLCQTFPLLRVSKAMGYKSYFEKDELAMVMYVGSRQDRITAQPILALAEAAFCDIEHTAEEQEALYGPLARYATPDYRGAVSQTHSLELWSAHFEEDKGYIWVYYSQEAFDEYGDTVCGSWGIPSLWYLEKEDNGRWVVTGIREMP